MPVGSQRIDSHDAGPRFPRYHLRLDFRELLLYEDDLYSLLPALTDKMTQIGRCRLLTFLLNGILDKAIGIGEISQ